MNVVEGARPQRPRALVTASPSTAGPPVSRRAQGDTPTTRRPDAWAILLFAGLAIIAANVLATYLRLPMTIHAVLYVGLAFGSVVSVTVGAVRSRHTRPLPWWLFAAALSLFFVGDLLFYYYDVVRLIDRPFPSVADAFYLGSYPFMIAGIVVLIRRRGRGGHTTVIDSSIIAIGVGVLFWVFVIEPVASQSDLPTLDHLISTAYPVMDVLVLAAAARLAVASFANRRVYSLLCVGICGLLTADASSGIIQLSRTFHVGTLVDVGWMCFYVCCGVSALHPSVRAIDEPDAEHRAGSDWIRLLVLATACLLAPALLAARWLVGIDDQSLVMLSSSMVLFVLALARMQVLTTALASGVARERSLRNSAASFVTATDAHGVRLAAITAARAVVQRADAAFALAVVEGDTTVILVSRATEDFTTSTVHHTTMPSAATLELAVLATFPEQPAHCLSTAMQAPSGLRGVLMVGAPAAFDPGLATVVDTLGSQVALALESASLTADLLRRAGEARFRSLVQNSSDLITVVECDGTITYQSPSVSQVLGHNDTELLGSSLLELVHPDDAPQTQAFLDRVTNRPGVTITTAHRLQRGGGAWVNMETVGSNLLDDSSVQGIVLTTRDVSERQAFEEQLHYQAFHDSLTALPNRRLLAERLEHALAQRVSDARPAALIFIDLDDYKSVNDTLGHHAGDEVLISVAATLLRCVRPGDTTARLGGDEFALLLPGIADRSSAVEVAERIIQALEVGIVVDGKEIFVGASIGIAFAGVDDGDAGALGFDDLVRNADVAMYTAKSRGKGRVEVYEPGMHSAVLNRLRLKADLQRALDHSEFLLHYQPIISLTTGEMTGAEALVRWVSPERGLVPPAEFIPLCEETGLIRRLGRWVLNEALWQAAQWSFAERSLTMNVNLSALQLQQPNLAAEVAAALALASVPADVLTLEVTESMLIGDVDASIRTLHDVRALGVRVVIDDFGTGYSSLSYLRQLPITGFKIDKEFVDAIASDKNDTLLLATVIELARSLGLETTAEGVESQDQMSALRELGCDLAQGYLFSRPLGAEQFDVNLRAALIAAGL